MQRKLATLLLGAVVVLSLPAIPAAGQTAGSRAAANGEVLLTASPAAGATVNSAGTFSVAVEAGAFNNQTLTVANETSDRRLTVRIAPVDGSRGSDGVTYSSKATDEGSGSWLAPTIGVVVLEPGTFKDVPFTIDVPRDAAPGDVAEAALRVFVESATDLDGAPASFDDIAVLHVPVTISVPGAPQPRLSITKVVAAKKDGAPHLAITVRNAGSKVSEGTGTVKMPGGDLTRDIHVRVEPRKEVTTLVEWQAIDAVQGVEVAVDLKYGDGDSATWVGIVVADPENVVAPPSTGEDEPAAPVVNGSSQQQNAPASGGVSAATLLTGLVVLMMVGALVWLGVELMGGRKPTTIPIDAAALPALQVTMDPRHTDVLDALVTQVGALGGAIGTLADKVGVAVPIPPAPSVLGTTPGRRSRHGARPRHKDEPVVVTTTPPVQERMAAVTKTMLPPPPPTHDTLPKPSAREIAKDIETATSEIKTPPIFGPVKMPDDWLDDEWKRDGVAPPLPSLAAPPPRRLLKRTAPPEREGGYGSTIPPDLADWSGPPDGAIEAFFNDAPDEQPKRFWGDTP